ncbi:MAG TPA: ABC transporter permease [Acidothermaceae bacterium]|jgi:lipooligosaccharide transport system permease protein
MTTTSFAVTPALRSYAYWVAQYRRTWRGSVISTVVSPVLYLTAMGVGLGSLVHRSSAIGGVTYLQFIGPGLLAATAMQIASGESTFPVFAGFKWLRVYHAMAATPLLPLDILVGHLMWIATRIALASGVYLGVVALFGGVPSPLGMLAFPACILIGLAFACPIVGFAASREHDNGFAALNRFGIVPMFLFSGTFFPVSQLPEGLRWVAYATPLWHGVELNRALTLGHVDVLAALGHVAYLLAWIVVGFVVTLRIYRRKLGV